MQKTAMILTLLHDLARIRRSARFNSLSGSPHGALAAMWFAPLDRPPQFEPKFCAEELMRWKPKVLGAVSMGPAKTAGAYVPF